MKYTPPKIRADTGKGIIAGIILEYFKATLLL
jgi:hypothetical protein